MSSPINKNYLGFNRSIKMDQLPQFEKHGFVLEEKYNGWWCCVDTADGLTHFSSRHNNELEAPTATLTSIFKGHDLIMVGEWMPEEHRLWAFDLLEYKNTDLRYTGLIERKWSLDMAVKKLNTPLVSAVPYYESGFAHVAASIIRDGGEGVALKHEDSVYHSNLKTKKTSFWIKSKPKYGATNETRIDSSRYIFSSSGGAYANIA